MLWCWYVLVDLNRIINGYSWCRHQMENISALLAFCVGNSPVTSEFPAQRPVTRRFDVFFDLRLNKRLSKQSWGWRLETLSRSLWRHCNVQLHYSPIAVEATLKYRDKVSRESCPYSSLDVLPLRPPGLYGEINHVYWEGIGNKQHSDKAIPDTKVHGANMGPTWVLSAPDGPHVCPMNLAIRGSWKYVNMPWDILYVSAKTYEMG